MSLAYAEGFTGNKSQTVASNASLTNGTYTSKTYQAWSELNGESLTIHPATTAKTFTITNLNSSASLGTNVLVTDGDTTEFEFKAAALDKKSVSITGGNFTVKLNGDVDTTAETITESKTLMNGTLSYQASGTGEHYAATSTGVTYTAQVGGETFTLSGITNADGVTISDKTVTVAENALNMSATETYTVELNGNDFTLDFKGNTSSTETSATLTNGTYTSAYTPAYFTGSGKIYNFTPATTFTISGLGSGAALGTNVIVANKAVTVKSGALTDNQSNITFASSDGYSLDFDAAIKQSQIAFKQTGNAVTLGGTTAGYAKVDGEYVWQDKVGGEELTITGLKDGATLTADMFTRNGNVITLKPTQELLPSNPTTITITGGGVIDTSALTTTKAESAHWNGTTYISKKTASSWTTNAATVNYTAATGGENLFTLNNLKANVTTEELLAAVDVSGTTITITDATILDSGKTVTVDKDYTLALSGSVTISEAKTEALTQDKTDKTKYSYNTAGNTEGYRVENNQILHYDNSVKAFTIGGLSSGAALGSNVIVEDKAVTVKSGALTASHADITFASSDGYSLDFDDNIKPSQITFKQTGDAVTLSGTTAGYTKVGDAYEWQEKVGGEPLTITGLKDGATLTDNMFTRSGNVITFKPTQALLPSNPTTITITGGGVIDTSALTTTNAEFAHWDGTTYISAKTASSWTTNTATVTYTAATGGETLFTLNNLKANVTTSELAAAVDVSGTTITIKSDATILDSGKTVTVDKDYTLALGGSVTISAAKTEALTRDKTDTTKYSYNTAGNTEGYRVESNQIVHYDNSVKAFTISGLSSTAAALGSNVIVANKAVTVKSGALTDNHSKITFASTDGYRLDFDADIKQSTIDFNQNGNAVTLSGTTAGYKLDNGEYVWQDKVGGEELTITGLKTARL